MKYASSAALAALLSGPALAQTVIPIDDGIGKKIAECVAQGAVRTIDGKDFHLRPGVDFRIVHNVPYNQYGVTWVQRIQADPAWAFAPDLAKKCIGQATGQVAAANPPAK